MAARDYFSHTTPEGVTFDQRIKNAGYPPGAENIARGQRTAESVMSSWMGSEGHRRNIENCRLTTIGVGLNTAADLDPGLRVLSTGSPPAVSHGAALRHGDLAALLVEHEHRLGRADVGGAVEAVEHHVPQGPRWTAPAPEPPCRTRRW